jgi:signal transduction histidine kinase
VRVELRREGDEAVVAVRDRGPGIPEEHLERVFDRFFSWRPEQEEGPLAHMGLGPRSRAIVEGYGGTLRAHSEPGRGLFRGAPALRRLAREARPSRSGSASTQRSNASR